MNDVARINQDLSPRDEQKEREVTVVRCCSRAIARQADDMARLRVQMQTLEDNIVFLGDENAKISNVHDAIFEQLLQADRKIGALQAQTVELINEERARLLANEKEAKKAMARCARVEELEKDLRHQVRRVIRTNDVPDLSIEL